MLEKNLQDRRLQVPPLDPHNKAQGHCNMCYRCGGTRKTRPVENRRQEICSTARTNAEGHQSGFRVAQKRLLDFHYKPKNHQNPLRSQSPTSPPPAASDQRSRCPSSVSGTTPGCRPPRAGSTCSSPPSAVATSSQPGTSGPATSS